MNMKLSQHARSRIRQRGLRESDLEIIVQVGTPVDDDSVFLLGRDVVREVRKHKQEIARLERLRGCRVVAAGDEKVVTAYRPSRKIEKRLLRGTHRHKHAGNPETNRSVLQFNGGYTHVR